MTWYASHIYVDPENSVIEILQAHRVLSRGLFWIKDLEDHEWFDEKSRHELPRNGIVVAREVCDPRLGKNRIDTDVEAQWHINRGYNVLSWNSIVGPDDLEIIMPPHFPVLAFGELDYTLDQNPPPLTFLRYLKQLAATTNTTVSFYHHRLGAEWAVRQEYAWIFGREECVYVAHGWKIFKYSATGVQENTSNDTVLKCLMGHYGLNLASTYFAPHRRGFNWNKHKLTTDPSL
jgi:hypothetical protein